jgi:hypothetical protein
MSIATLQKLIALWDEQERNLGEVEDRLRSAGMTDVNPALTASVAKYFVALQRLSTE